MAVALSEIQRPLTIEDYLDAPEDGDRFEIITGEMVQMPAPELRHSEVALALGAMLRSIVTQGKLGRVYAAPAAVRLGAHDVVEPDVFFVSKQRKGICHKRFVDGAPDMVAEVLSPGSRKIDLIKKRALYERSGIREYWIVDPDARSVAVMRLVEGSFLEERVTDGVIRSTVIQGAEVALEELFDDSW